MSHHVPDSLVDKLAIRAFEPPLSDRRWNAEIRDLSDPVNVGLLIVDFETEVTMNGIADFIGNHTGSYAQEIVQALAVVQSTRAAELLAHILETASAAGMTHPAIQSDRGGLAPFSITSFRELHGDKWRAALDNMYRLADQIDFEQVWADLDAYTRAHHERFETALRS